MKKLLFRLSVLNFLEFAVWGCYLTSFGNFLWHAGLEKEIFWFYAVQGIVSLFMPALMGFVADRLIEPRKVISGCHLVSAIMKGCAVLYCLHVPEIEFWPLFLMFGTGIAFYIPTIGLNNAFGLRCLKERGLDTSTAFPKVRVFGTVGFIAAMLMVNFIPVDGMPLQSTAWQLALSACFGILASFYVLTFKAPSGLRTQASENRQCSYIGLLRNSKVAWFLLFTFLISVCLQITNSYGNVFITSFNGLEQYARTWGARNANALISISQISETLCVLLIPFAMRMFNIKHILIIASMAWMLRFGFLGIGNTGSGIVFLILSMVVYGIAFDFVNIAGAIYLDKQVDTSAKNHVQALFMLVMSGLGATVGTPAAGAVVNKLVYTTTDPAMQMAGWSSSWFIFAAYALAISLLIFFIYPSRN